MYRHFRVDVFYFELLRYSFNFQATADVYVIIVISSLCDCARVVQRWWKTIRYVHSPQ